MDIDAEPANDKHPEANREEVEKLNNRAFFQPVTIQSAAVLEAVKARPGNVEMCLDGGATADLDSFCARRRPKSTVGAEESLRRGRTKERIQEREGRAAGPLDKKSPIQAVCPNWAHTDLVGGRRVTCVPTAIPRLKLDQPSRLACRQIPASQRTGYLPLAQQRTTRRGLHPVDTSARGQEKDASILTPG